MVPTEVRKFPCSKWSILGVSNLMQICGNVECALMYTYHCLVWWYSDPQFWVFRTKQCYCTFLQNSGRKLCHDIATSCTSTEQNCKNILCLNLCFIMFIKKDSGIFASVSFQRLLSKLGFWYVFLELNTSTAIWRLWCRKALLTWLLRL